MLLSDLPARALARAEREWRAGSTSKCAIAKGLGISPSSLRRLAITRGWGERGAPAALVVSVGAPEPADPTASAPTPAPDDAPLTESERARALATLGRLVTTRLEQLRRRVARGQDRNPDRTAREITHYARLLRTIPELGEDAPDDGSTSREPPARSLGELRDELRRHLERVRAEERSRRLRRTLDPR